MAIVGEIINPEAIWAQPDEPTRPSHLGHYHLDGFLGPYMTRPSRTTRP
jgi:hypothetical protein